MVSSHMTTDRISQSLRTALCCPGTLPRPKKCPPDTFLYGLSSPITIPNIKRKDTKRYPFFLWGG